MEFSLIQKRLQQLNQYEIELTNLIMEEIKFLKEKANLNISFISENPENNKSFQLDEKRYLELKEEMADKKFLSRISSKLSDIPESNGSNYFEKMDIQIGIICDEFLYNSFKDIAHFYYINRNSYKSISVKLDVLIIASTWRGLEDDWKGFANPNNKNVRNELDNVISYFKSQGTKIVFYSKEDPTNYHLFVDVAKKSDYIFTTALEKVESYKRDCKNENVYVLEFGVNPVYNNPIGLRKDENEGAIFAGSWYEKYPHRKLDTKTIFDGVLWSGNNLKIIDRNFDKNLPNHFYPTEYLHFISPSIDHSTLQKVFKIFPWAINLNSVQESETMFANRVYELQAMGNLILSNYSLGINNLFPNIFLVENSSEIKYIMNNVSDIELYRHRMHGVRTVLRKHTTYHRISKLLSVVDVGSNYIFDKRVAVVVDNIDNNQHVENFTRQSYKHKELISIEEVTLNYNNYDYITFFNPEYEYGEYYLEDMVNGFKYTNSSYVTKDSFYNGTELIEGIEHNYVEKLKDKYKTVFSTRDFKVEDVLSLEENIELKNGYSIDCLELNISKVKKNETPDLKLSVIIPVYNNGEHLYSKCFMSLLRSSIFENMDIILVDDGSTEEETITVINRLERLYSNVQVFKYDDGGSGSASRPRNKGLELAKTDYITYLDPDNEAINDGYYQLLNELENDKSVDLVVGDIIKIDTRKKILNYSKNLFNYNQDGIVTDTYDFLKKSKLRAQSIQALIVKKEIIKNNNLEMVEKAAGQDTLFFQQLILCCSKIKAIDLAIHIYYAAVSNSVTNSISKRFFEKYLILERERFAFLNSNKLLKRYITDRFESYFVGWYFSRVPKIKMDEMAEGLDILYQIYLLYKPYIKTPNEILNRFDYYLSKKKYKDFYFYCDNYFNEKVNQ